jgi:hypothetical protein
MPIRFRCAYCNQLLGIARRKAGTVVRCPTCAGQVVVPAADAGAEPDPDEPRPAGDQPVFERSDFDELFNNPKPATEAAEPTAGAPSPRKQAGGGTGTAAPPAEAPVHDEAWGTHADPDVEVEPLGIPPQGGPSGFQPPYRPSGIVLSPTKATILTVVIVVGLAVAFAAGLLVGRFLLTG